MGVLRSKLTSGACRHAHNQGNGELPTGHVPQGCCRIHQRIEGEQTEVHGHDFDNRPHATQGRADTGPHEAQLGQRRVSNALGAERFKQPQGNGIAATVTADVFAHQKYPWVPLQRVAQGFAHRFAIRHASAHDADLGV
ncbi:hypothetical protein D3C85_1414680 [compost metagenome]